MKKQTNKNQKYGGLRSESFFFKKTQYSYKFWDFEWLKEKRDAMFPYVDGSSFLVDSSRSEYLIFLQISGSTLNS